MTLDLETILAADDLPREKVTVPEWGGEVWIRSLPLVERDQFFRSVEPENGEEVKLDNFRARLVAWCLAGEDGAPLCVNPLATAEQLGRKSGAAVFRCYQVAARLNAMRPSDVEALAKN